MPFADPQMPFADRRDAGRRLAAAVAPLELHQPVVLALPRGGVPVGYELAQALGAPLDVLMVRKLGCPGQPELGLGAIAEDGVELRNTDLIREAGTAHEQLAEIARREHRELDRRVQLYRQGRVGVALADRSVVLVDDGLATGFTARAGIAVVRRRGAAQVVVAVPVAPAETVAQLRELADEVVCLETPADFVAIGGFYADFTQVSDAEVVALLDTGLALR